MASRTAVYLDHTEEIEEIDATLVAKFDDARAGLNGCLIERSREIDTLLVALVAKEHFLMIGEPGSAKSALLDHITGSWFDGPTFSTLMTKHTPPEELLGQLSLSQLKLDNYRRVTKGCLPEAVIGFGDEIWKTSSASANTLLRILNERVYMQEGKWLKAPLHTFLAASNEWPNSENGGKELAAIFDRFLFRKTIATIRPGAGLERLLFASDADFVPTFATRINALELQQAHEQAMAITWSQNGADALRKIIAKLAAEGVIPSDRRKRKSTVAARAAAWLAGSNLVEPEHLEILQHVLWDDPTDQPRKAAEIVMEFANPGAARVSELVVQLEEIIAKCDVSDTGQSAEATKKIQSVIKSLKALPASRNQEQALAMAQADAKAFRDRAIAAFD